MDFMTRYLSNDDVEEEFLKVLLTPSDDVLSLCSCGKGELIKLHRNEIWSRKASCHLT